MSQVISFIIPYSERCYSVFDARLAKLLSQLSEINNVEIIVHTVGTLFTSIINELAQAKKVCWLKYGALNNDKCYSASQARNAAVHHAKGEYLFFVDVDLLLHTNLLNTIVTRVQKLQKIGKQAFEMYPCIYLSENATTSFNNNFNEVLNSYLKGENHLTDGIALASSCLLVNRKWFQELGGFNSQFVGHGGEDLEFIHRLCLHYPLAKFFDGYHQNIKAQHPADYEGFRRYMACYALPHLFEGRFLVHKWHPRPLTNKYHKLRKRNDLLLEKIIKESIKAPNPIREKDKCELLNTEYFNKVLSDKNAYQKWISNLQQAHGFSVDSYPGLFSWKDNIKIKRSFLKKLRKLYLNPKLFFLDMVKKII